MKCKSCKNTVPDGSMFCMFCGEKLVKTRNEKKEISVPKPRHLPSGTWFAQLAVDGQRVSVSAPTEAEYYAKARAVKAGLIEEARKAPRCTLKDAMKEYLASIDKSATPSSLRSYDIIMRSRCLSYQDQDINSIDYQRLVNDEAKHLAPKTVANTWDFVCQTLKYKGIDPPKVKRPQLVPTEGDFLDYQQIGKFLEKMRGSRSELAAILALHSLRQSEILDLTVDDIKGGNIIVHGATVRDKSGKYVHKAGNKNSTSWRTVPVIIPRLNELLPSEGHLVTIYPTLIGKDIKAACRALEYPECSLHDLRRSFASLAYHLEWKDRTTMLVGGWSNMATVKAVYEKLAQADQQADIEKMRKFYSDFTNENTNKS